MGEHIEVDDMPRAGSASLIKLWGPDCLVYTVGSALHIYDYRKRQLRQSLIGHGAEIVAVDAHGHETIATLSADACVKLWRGATGECLQSLTIPAANFFLRYPYCLRVHARRVVVSADEGVYLVELGTSGPHGET